MAAGGRFAFEARLDGPYFYCRQDQMVRAARLLADVADLSMQARRLFCCSVTSSTCCPVQVCIHLRVGKFCFACFSTLGLRSAMSDNIVTAKKVMMMVRAQCLTHHVPAQVLMQTTYCSCKPLALFASAPVSARIEP